MYICTNRQNLIGVHDDYREGDFWGSPASTYLGTTELAPDNVSYAQVWSGDGVTWLYNRHLLDTSRTPDTIFIASAYIKPFGSELQRFTIGVQGGDLNSYSVYVQDGEVVTDSSDANSLGGGHYSIGNGWHRVWALTDHTCYTDTDYRRLLFYPNAPHGSAVPDQSVAVWGVQAEETNKRLVPSALYKTDNAIFTGDDYHVIYITQKPSAIIEKQNAIFKQFHFIDGTKERISKYVDKETRTLVWDSINYVTNSVMLYRLRESCVNNSDTTSSIYYDTPIKKNVVHELVRFLDFRFTYSTTVKDHAQVEVDYIIEGSLPY